MSMHRLAGRHERAQTLEHNLHQLHRLQLHWLHLTTITLGGNTNALVKHAHASCSSTHFNSPAQDPETHIQLTIGTHSAAARAHTHTKRVCLAATREHAM